MPTILGPDGKELPADRMIQAKKACVEAWIAQTVEGDAELGRSSSNFQIPPEKEIAPFLPSFKEKNIKIYVGSGNLILVDMKPKNPMVVQRRPLAQRQVQIVLE